VWANRARKVEKAHLTPPARPKPPRHAARFARRGAAGLCVALERRGEGPALSPLKPLRGEGMPLAKQLQRAERAQGHCSNLASMDISALSNREIGQPALAALAAALNCSGLAPGILAVTSR
jgi:hypothetical protein